MTKANRILLKARRHIVGDRIGNNSSMFRGEGYDFIELREYVSGDDVRHINWNVTAKMGKPFVKVFRQERELNVLSVALLGGSFMFGEKLEILAQTVATIGYSAIANGDLYGHCNGTQNITFELPPSKKNFAVTRAVEGIMSATLLHQKVDMQQVLNQLYQRTRRKSLIILAGDFFQLPDIKLLAKKHEVVAIVIRDSAEEKPAFRGYNALIDPESGAMIEGDFTPSTLNTYARNLQQHDTQLFDIFRTAGVRATKLYAHNNPAVVLRRLFEERT